MQLKLEILPKEQREIHPHLKQITDMGFILFGGTAIALQLGHRTSIDFDFFCCNNINDIKSKLCSLNGIEAKKILQNKDNTFVFNTCNGVKISLFGDIHFANTDNSFVSSDNILRIANIKSLLATKLKAICDRAECKDYKDIVEILKTKQSDLNTGIALLKKFVGYEIPTAQILKTLTYFNDGDLHKLNDDDRKILESSVLQYKFNLDEKWFKPLESHIQNKANIAIKLAREKEITQENSKSASKRRLKKH